VNSRSAFDIWWDFVCAFMDWTHGHCGSADDDEIKKCLPPHDWLLYLLAMVSGSLENSGSFAMAVGGFPEHGADLKTAFLKFGCPGCAALVDDCIAFRSEGDAASEWSDELDAREQEIEERAHFSYEPIVDFLRTHDRDFSFSILSYCQEKPES
jgi:hypothetical protein